ncbi:hypothetical protein EVAR_92109_1 [Eumeta japonica]|uniref:Uncharacterized protein n=1 Tax=Eumeta variegata TaxID=151549 RepID=A0A4C1SYE7_EUMVA|nr:hypothetical protein EVAR_92109_1 [Eumeta japonica]
MAGSRGAARTSALTGRRRRRSASVRRTLHPLDCKSPLHRTAHAFYLRSKIEAAARYEYYEPPHTVADALPLAGARRGRGRAQQLTGGAAGPPARPHPRLRAAGACAVPRARRRPPRRDPPLIHYLRTADRFEGARVRTARCLNSSTPGYLRVIPMLL